MHHRRKVSICQIKAASGAGVIDKIPSRDASLHIFVKATDMSGCPWPKQVELVKTLCQFSSSSSPNPIKFPMRQACDFQLFKNPVGHPWIQIEKITLPLPVENASLGFRGFQMLCACGGRKTNLPHYS
jgi:hypothetical protein